MTNVAFDSSVLLTWILQEPTWQRVDALLSNPQITPVLAGPVLTEVVHRARVDGNTSTPSQLWTAFSAHGAVIAHPEDDDLLRAAELREASDAHPGPHHATLSLGDALILATVERLGVKVVTRDRYWSWFAAQGHTTATVLDYVSSGAGR
ncbi:PIN domain-containing protein [Cellulomonas sp. S1-8]|uniref:PIN domain-containing protein n=1 Tax=Cellulomonas sp. S1-8 TaxID=2904790 RepID=UPI002243A78C|nr:PIN domain-containing protein [Cellulomonas sp. S1-8]UZN03528.1 PIN domain-containing protein [Cellulomonas sp. S1-8]